MPTTIDADDRTAMALMRLLEGNRGRSRQDNEALLNTITATGYVLPPVVHVMIAWNFGDGRYGDVLLVNTPQEGWREMLSSVDPHWTAKDKRDRHRITFVQNIYPTLFSYVASRDPNQHEHADYSKVPETAQTEIERYYIHKQFMGALLGGKPQAMAFGGRPMTGMPATPFSLAALIISRRGTGAILSRGYDSLKRTANELVFVPWRVSKLSSYAVEAEMLPAEATAVELDDWWNIIATHPFHEQELILPVLQHRLLLPGDTPTARRGCSVIAH